MAISSALGGGTSGGFAHEFSRAIAARGVTLVWLSQKLKDHGNPVSVAALSYWKNGRRVPEGAQSLAAVEDLEQLLQLERDTLSQWLHRSRRVGAIGQPRLPIGRPEWAASIDELVAALECGPSGRIRERAAHLTADVGRNGNVTRVTTRALVQSVFGTVTSFAVANIRDDVMSVLPVPIARGGGSIPRTFLHPSRRLFGFAFEFEEPLAPGETMAIEYALDFPPGYPASRYVGHATRRQQRDCVVWVRFAPDAIPDWIEEVEIADEVENVISRFMKGTSIHADRSPLAPGLLGLQWGYADR
ncbi:hypothetical protein [Microbacterium sp. No. 7]|uniref:hypothetical protein n=1 Tax=Microbacterium sp. No. 7 TaxID=1714373 RepID=UPI0006CF5BBD|nr:hypothetical protein [Microbacterium sp. No. 7]ALJ19432.1 hypothetical protein AOA12_05725 [Microbacterium sp. No. 7]